MAQKTNPENFRSGLSNFWQLNSQNYGRFSNFHSILFLSNFKSIDFFFKMFKTNKVFIHNVEFWYTKSKIFILFFFDKTLSLNNSLLFSSNILNLISFWSNFQICVKIKFYSNYYQVFFSTLFLYYIEYLSRNLNYTPRKLFNTLFTLISRKINTIKVTFTSKGPLLLNFSGFKLNLKGRFENSKNPMSKKLELKFGNLNLTGLNNEVIYVQKSIFTKFGVCNLKIWLFYTFNKQLINHVNFKENS